MNVRAAAAVIVSRVAHNGQSLDHAFATAADALNDSRDRALCQQICYGVLRWYLRLEAISQYLLKKPIRKKERHIQALVLVGLYQMMELHTAEHAIITETVNAARELNKDWATGLINALLRRYQRESKTIHAIVDKQVTQQLSHPDWLLKRIRNDWPDHWRDILEANNRQAPMALRVNQQKTTREQYHDSLTSSDIAALVDAHSPQALVLEQPCQVSALPDFAQGFASVQDVSAQLAAEFLDCQPGQHVLDACAAPGGKTCAILEQVTGDLHLTALDSDPKRLVRVQENLERLQLNANLVTGSALTPNDWWNGTYFDRILLDAPCSGTGVIRRHPDIKLLRRDNDIEQLAKQQLKMLSALWPLMNSGGMLLYSTCSILREENEQSVDRFLTMTTDATELPLNVSFGHPCAHGFQVLPGENNQDGFFYTLLTKQ